MHNLSTPDNIGSDYTINHADLETLEIDRLRSFVLDEWKIVEKESTKSPAEIYLQYSHLDDQERAFNLMRFQALADSIQLTTDNPYKAAIEVKRHLIANGWTYHEHIIQLEQVLKYKQGNCLSLSLLIGAILETKGLKPDYQILSNPEDAISRGDTKLLEEFEMDGAWISRDNPKLCSLKDWKEQLANIERPNRFGLAEHPVISYRGKVVETTNLDPDAFELWSPTRYQNTRQLTFEQLATTLIVEILRRDPRLNSHEKFKDSKLSNRFINDLLEAVEIWDGNYEAWYLLLLISRYKRELLTQKLAGRKFDEFEVDNARYYYSRFFLDGHTQDIQKAFELCPTSSAIYLDHSRATAQTVDDQKFDLAVVSYMVALSSEQNLEKFYHDHKDYIEKLFGEDYYRDLIDEGI